MSREKENVYGSQQILSSIALLLETPNFIAVAMSAIFTGSLITWMDLMDSCQHFFSDCFVLFLSKKLKKNLKYEYNYGIGKIEAIASFCVDFMMALGLFVLLFCSVRELFDPKKPSGLLLYVIGLKLVNIFFDVFYFLQQKKIRNISDSMLVNTEYVDSIKALLFDIVAFLAIFVAYFFRGYSVSWIFSPAISILIAVYFLVGCVFRIRKSVFSLTDHTLSEEKQLFILKALNTHFEEYKQIVSINSHMNGNQVVVELNVEFYPDTTYAEIEKFLNEVSVKLKDDMEDPMVNLTISEKA